MTAHHKNTSKNVFIALIFVSLLLMLVSIFNLNNFIKRKPEVIVKDTLENQISYWQEFIDENPTYRDGYLILSKLYIEKGNFKMAQNLVKRAYIVDPISSEVKKAGKVLGISSY